MLTNLGGRSLTNPTHHDTWRLIIHSGNAPRRLTKLEFDLVHIGMVRDIIGTHDEVTVPGFKAGANWTGKPWDILFWKCAGQDERLAAWMFGLMAQYAFIKHPKHWVTGSTTYVGRDFPNAYYFLDKFKNGGDE